MDSRRLGRAAALALLCAAPSLHALGLGDARVTSGLNAPLVAEIEVVDATPAELAALRAEIPGRDVFTRYGLDWPAFLATASVSLRTSADGKPVLVLRTEQAVSEPFVTVLVAANWGRGRVLREFNLVVDRPSEVVEPLTPIEVQAPAVEPGRSGTVDRAQEVAPETPPARIDIPRPAERPAARPSADSVTVRSGDTLGRIAASVARRSGVSTSQAMVGIYEANRTAFVGSMNDLRAGAVLRIPDAAELAALPPALVSGEVNRAISQWRSREGAPTQVADPSGRLRLVAPSEVSVGTGGAQRATAEAKAAAKPKSSAGGGRAAPDASASKAAPAESVDQRLARIEQQLLEKQRLLDVASSQLAELQARAAATPADTQAGLMTTLGALFGKVWWLWVALLLAVLGLVGLLLGARRRAAAAEAELQAWASAPRAGGPTLSMPVDAPAAPVASIAEPSAPIAAAATDDLEGDPPMIDEAGSKIDLARAFIEMGDPAAARAELEAVLKTGDEAQRDEAQRLLDSLG